ncbi:hypothetical protein F5Y06DRAFT_130376 [Hypoxylon sp. FL0890]|nr:hypothetical protein F5Y06DRAFT_130376 [Hypoxylon sp. FL0890]
MAAPISTISTHRQINDVVVREQTSQQGSHEFTLFPRLPPELQLRIWKFTLPEARFLSGRHDISAIILPVYEVKQALTMGHPSGEMPIIRHVPQFQVIPATLHAYRASRHLALKSFVLSPIRGTSNLGNIVRPNDIVDINSPTLLIEDLLKTPKSHTDHQVSKLKHLAATVFLQNKHKDNFIAKEEKLLYDIGSGRLCIILSATPQIDGSIVRSSFVEEWLFGSRITIGQVPEYLRGIHEQGPEAGTLRLRPSVKTPSLRYSDPVEVLNAYVWLLHRISLAEYYGLILRNCTRRCTPYGTLRVFISIMDGGYCPVCKDPILGNIKALYPNLSLERLDILYTVPYHDFKENPLDDIDWNPFKWNPLDDVEQNLLA